MNGRELKTLWQSGTPSFGAAITTTDPAIAAVICNIGYDWVLVDGEHHPFNPETLRAILATIRARDVVPIVRVAENDAALIKQALDFGAEGIMVPMLRTAAEARQAAAACRYPPQGSRGFSPRDASNYYKDLDAYLQTINDRVIVLLQVEHVDAVNCLDEFLTTPGLDAVLIGPGDLSFSMGHPLQPHHPAVKEAIDTAIAKCRAARLPVGTWVDGAAEVQAQWIQRGLNFLLVGSDCGWVTEAGGAMLRALRQMTGGR